MKKNADFYTDIVNNNTVCVFLVFWFFYTDITNSNTVCVVFVFEITYDFSDFLKKKCSVLNFFLSETWEKWAHDNLEGLIVNVSTDNFEETKFGLTEK